MSPADLSIFVFGIYVVAVIGIGFVAMPNVVLRVFRVPETKEVWIRILGFVVAVLGGYYIVGGLCHLEALAWASVFGRFAVLVFLVVLVLLKQGKPQMVLFGVVDAAGALWTLLALQ